MEIKQLIPKLVVFLLRVITGKNIDDYYKLHDDLFKTYKTDVTPFSNISDTLEVSVGFHLFAVNSFNEVEGTLSLVGGLSFIWIDESLTWDPAKYNWLDRTTTLQSKIWTPDVVLLNDAYKLAPIGSDYSFTIGITSDGQVQWTPGCILNVKCPANIKKFPFDSHSCKLRFSGWGYHYAIVFTPRSTAVDLTHFYPNQDWTLESNSIEYDSLKAPGFNVTLHIKREPVYYNVLIFVPIAVLAMLNPLVFLLPLECGERLSFGMTILLSYIVFLTLVSDQIPATSNPMSFLIIFIILLFVTNSAITVCNIINTKLWFWSDNSSIEGCQRSIVLMFERARRKSNIANVSSEEHLITRKDLANAFDKIYLCCYYVIMLVLMTIYFLEMTVS